MADAYAIELDRLIAGQYFSTRRERIFLQERLKQVTADLDTAANIN